MRPTVRRSLIAVVLLSALFGNAAPAAPFAVPEEGPDIAPATAPAASVTVFDHERFQNTEGVRTRAFTVPSVTFDRVVLSFHGVPDQDPYDRLFGVSLAGVEVLRGTTPRADFTIRRDVTRYARLLPPGATVAAGLMSGAYLGAQVYTVTLDFYASEPTAALVDAPAAAVLPVVLWASLHCSADTRSQVVDFGPTPPSGATAEITITGHGQDGEFWYLHGARPRMFHVQIDGREVATTVGLPYVYALAGVEGGNDLVHPVVWWSAHQALDIAGVHTGVGEVPAYRARLDASDVALLSGSHVVSIVQEGGSARSPSGKCSSDANWVTSLSVLLDR